MPSLHLEKSFWDKGLFRVVGVDEVGMASLAGPVVAAAVLVTPGCRLIRAVRDSKVLTRAQREALVPLIRERAVRIGVGAASVAEIHRLNIYHASHLAMQSLQKACILPLGCPSPRTIVSKVNDRSQ